MKTFNFNKNMLSSVAEMSATLSSCANNGVIFGTAVAVPFFIVIFAICIIMNIDIIIIHTVITVISILIIRSNRCKVEQQNRAV